MANQTDLDIVYDESIEEKIQSGDDNPFGKFRIRVDETYLLGSESGYISDWMTGQLYEQLSAVRAVMEGKAAVVEVYESYLFFRPNESDRSYVSIMGCHELEPKPRQSQTYDFSKEALPDADAIVGEATVPLRVIVQEIFDTAVTYRAWLLSVNPELEDGPTLTYLDGELEEVEGELKRQDW